MNDEDQALRTNQGPHNPLTRLGFVAGVIGLCVVVMTVFWLRLDLIEARGLYPQHKDERHLAVNAFRMVREHTLDPHFFRYGSFPIYLTYAATQVGVLVGKLNGTVTDLSKVSVGLPYYSHAEVSLPPRWLFLTIAMTTLALTGVLGYSLDRKAAMLVLPALALCLSDSSIKYSWAYLNVDTVTSALAIGALTLLARTHQRHDLRARVLWPALFCGAITATKYNHGLLGVPFLIAIAYGPPELRLRHMLALLGGSLLVYLAVEPYTLITPQRFISDVLFELKHYREGHRGATGEPGLDQLGYYLSALVDEFSLPLSLLGVVGIAELCIRDRRLALLLLAYPLAILVHLSSNRTHFVRNLMPVITVYAVFIGNGVVVLFRLSAWLTQQAGHAVSQRIPSLQRAVSPLSSLVALTITALVLSLVNDSGVIARARAMHVPSRDGRDEIVDYLLDNAEPGCVLLTITEAELDTRRLHERCKVVVVNLDAKNAEARFNETLANVKTVPTYLAFPTWSFRRSRPESKPVADERNEWIKRFRKAKLLMKAGRSRLVAATKYPVRPNPSIKLYRLKNTELTQPKVKAPPPPPKPAELPDDDDVDDDD